MNKTITMKKLFFLTIIIAFLVTNQKSAAQELKKLTLDDVIKLAEEQSPNALMAKHRFRASYWQYRTFKAMYRPALTLTGNTQITQQQILVYGMPLKENTFIFRQISFRI